MNYCIVFVRNHFLKTSKIFVPDKVGQLLCFILRIMLPLSRFCFIVFYYIPIIHLFIYFLT